MAINDSVFGIHSVTPYSLATGLPLSAAPFKVLGTFNVSLTQEIIELFGGSSFDAFDTELGARTFEGSMLLRQFPNALIEIATGTKPTVNAAEAAGSVTALKNASGTLFEATTGIASIGLKSGSSADVPFASYTVVAASATTVDVFVNSDVDFAQGTDKSFVSGSQKVNATPLTITGTSGVTDLADFGLEFTGGSGTVALTIGDSATFESRPANTSSRIVNIGSPLARPQNIGLMAYTQRKSDGSMYKINVYNALVAGLPLTLTEKAFSEVEVSFKAKRATDIITGNEGLYSIEQVLSSSL